MTNISLRWILVLVAMSGCGGSSGTEVNPPPPPPPSLTVTGVAPGIGHPGESNLEATISGTNFQSGVTVAWERNGTAEPKVQVASLRVVNSTTMVVTLNIATDAPYGFYDVAASGPGSSKAVLSTRFEMTQGYPMTGTRFAFAVNDAGTAVGRWNDPALGFVWTQAGGRKDLPTEAGNVAMNGGRAIDEAGTTIAGVSANDAAIWTTSGPGWVRNTLPRDAASGYALALSIGSDATTGRAAVIAGAEGYGMDGLKENPFPADNQRPRAWVLTGGAWQRVVLPTPAGTLLGTAHAASASGRVAGYVTGSRMIGAVWTPDGAGGWTLDLLQPGPGQSGSTAVAAINSAGDLAVGVAGNAGTIAQGGLGGTPAYWVRTGSSWSTARMLSPTPQCSGVAGVDDFGRILGSPCRPDGRRWVPVVWIPPYDEASIRTFGGLGDMEMGGRPKAISRNGKWIVGATYWTEGFDVFTGALWRGF